MQPFRRIKLVVHIAISVLPGTHFHLSQVKNLRAKYLAQGHNIKQCPKIDRGGGEHVISQKILHQAGLEAARQAVISVKCHALIIVTCPSL